METRACSGSAFKPATRVLQLLNAVLGTMKNAVLGTMNRQIHLLRVNMIYRKPISLSSESIEHPQHMEEKAQRHP